MKMLSRDITVTLVIKIILLVLLWWVCVRGFHPVLKNAPEWLLGEQHHTELR